MPQPDKRKAISTNCCLLRLHIDSFSRWALSTAIQVKVEFCIFSGIFPRFSVNVLRICGSCWCPCGGWPVLANCCSLDLQLAEPGALCITQGITDRKTACPDSAVTFKTKHKVSNQFLSCASSHGRPRFHFRVTCALVIAGLECQQNRELLSVKTKLPRVASRLPGVKAVNMRCRTSRCYQPCSYLCCVVYIQQHYLRFQISTHCVISTQGADSDAGQPGNIFVSHKIQQAHFQWYREQRVDHSSNRNEGMW